jgi:hypothetical protein
MPSPKLISLQNISIVWQNALVAKIDSIFSICNTVSAYYAIVCLTSSLSKSSSHSSQGWHYWGEIDYQIKLMSVDFIFNPFCTSWWTFKFSSDLYRKLCCWVNKFIFVFSHTFCYKFARVIIFALPPIPLVWHPKVLPWLTTSFEYWVISSIF